MSPAQSRHPEIARSGSERAPERRSWGAVIVKTFTSAIALVLKAVLSALRRILKAIVDALFSDLF